MEFVPHFASGDSWLQNSTNAEFKVLMRDTKDGIEYLTAVAERGLFPPWYGPSEEFAKEFRKLSTQEGTFMKEELHNQHIKSLVHHLKKKNRTSIVQQIALRRIARSIEEIWNMKTESETLDYYFCHILNGLLASGHFTHPCCDENHCSMVDKGSVKSRGMDFEDRPYACHVITTKEALIEYGEENVKGSCKDYDVIVEARQLTSKAIAIREEYINIQLTQ